MDHAQKSPTVLSLCTGYGGIELGLEAIFGTVTPIAYVEIECFPIANLVSKMESGEMVPTPIWTDLKTFNAKPFRGYVDILTGGYPCFTEDAHVLTKQGYKQISRIQIGDVVLSHTGNWRKVTATMRKSDADVNRIRFNGGVDLFSTVEHPFYARKKYKRTFNDPEWIRAEKLDRNSYIGQVLPPVRNDNRSDRFWWVVGRFLADGWVQKSPSQSCGRVTICCSFEEGDDLEKEIQKAGFKSYRSNERTTTRFAIVNKEFYEFCLQFGKGANGKKLPGRCLELPEDKARALLDGYLSGDGHYSKNPKGKGNKWRVSTVSPALAHGIALLAQRAYGIIAGIRIYTPKRQCVIEGRKVNERKSYIVDIPERNREAFVDNEYGWKPVRSNERQQEKKTVYNIAVEHDESYIVNGAIVHNCQPFSQAGKRRGEEDPRHLWPYIKEIVKDCEPRYVFFENVEGHLSNGIVQVLSDLELVGYKPEVGIFSASEVGAPHQRKRIFILGKRIVADSGELRPRRWESSVKDRMEKWKSDIKKEEQIGHNIRCETQGCCGKSCMGNTEHDGSSATENRQSAGKEQEEGWLQESEGRCCKLGDTEHDGRNGFKITGSSEETGDNDTQRSETSCEFKGTGRSRISCHLWPARPGEPQHPWEEPRVLADTPGRRQQQCESERKSKNDVDEKGKGKLANTLGK